MKTELKEFYSDIVRKKSYWLPIVFFAIIAYGFSMVNRTVSIDDMSQSFFFKNDHLMMAATRWGMTLWVYFFSMPVFTAFVKKFLGVCFFICGATVMACVGHYLFKGKNVWTYTIFSSVLATYPLINEIWEYDVVNLCVGGNFLLAAVAVLFQVTYQGDDLKKISISALPLTVIASSYESGVFLYICAVCLYIFCKYAIKKAENPNNQWIKEGMGFALPLVLAVILRIIIGLFLIWVMGLEYNNSWGADSNIYWGTDNFLKIAVAMLKGNGLRYIMNAMVYFPITVFLIAAIAFFISVCIISIKQHRILPAFLGVIVLVSIFFQSVIQGYAMPYRTAQTVGLFVAFVAAATVEISLMAKRKKIGTFAVAAGLLLCLHQGGYLNNLFVLNNQRSNNEIAVVHQIGYRLKSEFNDKTVIFVGMYDNGEWISSQTKIDTNTAGGKLFNKVYKVYRSLGGDGEYDAGGIKYVDSNVNPVMNWAKHAFYSQRCMKELFSYCGYDIEVLDYFDDELDKEYSRIAKEEGLRPFEIRDMGDYILVSIGEIE